MLKRFSLIKVTTRIKNGQIVYCEDFSNDGVRDEKDQDEHYEQFISRVKYAVKHDLVYSDKQSFTHAATFSSSVGDPGNVSINTDIQSDGQVVSGHTDEGIGSFSSSNSTWNTNTVSLADYSIQWTVSAPHGGTSSAPDSHTPSSDSSGFVALSSNNDFDSSITGLNQGQTKDVRWTVDIRTDTGAGGTVSGSTITHTYQELS